MGMNIELQRYGRNKSTIIDHGYISSGKYRRKFNSLTDNKKLNRLIYKKAKEMLIHRSGTMYEDMYWFDADNVKVIAKELNSCEEEQILYSDSVKKVIDKSSNVIAVHTHPCSMPPSVADFNSLHEHGYMLGIVLCHDGKLFCYKSEKIISQKLYDLYVAYFYNKCHDEYEAQICALKALSSSYGLEFWEVI